MDLLVRVWRWRLWGLVLCGCLSALLWVRGFDWFGGSGWWLAATLVGLPVIGGALTTESPKFTATVFAMFSDSIRVTLIRPMAIFFWALRPEAHWTERLGALFFAAAETWTMWLLYAPLVYAGRWVRLRVFR